MCFKAPVFALRMKTGLLVASNFALMTSESNPKNAVPISVMLATPNMTPVMDLCVTRQLMTQIIYLGLC